MSELVLKEALGKLAAEAAERFAKLLREGEEIPFELDDGPGNGLPLYRYVPQTRKFIERHAAELRKLRSFKTTCTVITSAGAADAFLEEAGMPVPPDEQRRAEQLIVVFCERLFEDSEDFALDTERLDRLVAEIEFGNGSAIREGVNVFCPLVGLQLPVTKLELATATIIRSEATDLPKEALHSQGMGRAAWEPQFVAVAQCLEGQQPAEVIGAQLTEMITAMRLLQPGGVALGPYAWTKSGEGWRRMSTGAARPRPGGYVLGEAEAIELADLTRALAARPERRGALGWALTRFESGGERETIFDALSDYLLALRAMLDGGGPAGAGLPMRVAALCAETGQRAELQNAVEQALVLEGRLMGGGGVGAAGDDEALKVAAVIEDHLRAILRDAACGDLGDDLRATADEILVADGVPCGDGVADQGETSEWEPPEWPGQGIRVYATKKTSEPPQGPKPSTGAGMTNDTRPEFEEPATEEGTPGMEINSVTPIERGRAKRVQRLERESNSAARRAPRPSAAPRYSARELFPTPETDWSIGELRFSR